ncbi:MAG: SGNH/GDSL hydrolase family protein [Actinomycetes bacterium]
MVAPVPWTSFFALGDSFTEGMSDELRPDGRYRGWADRVAETMAASNPSMRYANLAVRGKLIDQVVVEQLIPALDMLDEPKATLVSFHGGPNDALRPRVDLSDLANRYERAVRLLTNSGVTVMLFTVIERAGGTGRTADRLARRFATFNDSIRATARHHEARLVDQAALPALNDRRMWNDDRLHLAPEGHRRVAALAWHVLSGAESPDAGSDEAWWTQPLPPRTQLSRRQAVAEDSRWVRSHLAPWVGRRLRGVSSGDGVEAKDTAPHPVATAPQP